MLTNIRQRLFRRRAQWEQNLVVLWFGNFMAGVAFSLIMPFMSLYIDTLGNFTTAQLSLWSGVTYSITFLVTALISPWWGKIADRRGRKLMLLRASLGLAIVLGAMGLVQNIYELIGLRLLQGFFSGYISNSNALIATSAPQEKSGQALGTLTTGSVSGTLLGPLLGGIIAQATGYRTTFFITGTILFIVFILCLVFVHEDFTPVEKGDQVPGRQLIHELKYPHLIIGMFVTTMIIQASNNSISPLLSLYVRQLMHHGNNVALVSGVVAATPGIATLIAAPRFGALGDRIGSEKILLGGLIFAVFVYVPQAFVQNVWQLGALRLLVGVADAALLPQVQTILAKYSPHSSAGRIFSYNQSFQAMGNVAGPLIGSSVSGLFGYSGVFLSTTVLVIVNLFWVRQNTKVLREEHEIQK
ncbi:MULTISPECIES: multidrug efflux MFS transporter [Latilactobacillus]|jgi:DHA1 family multidrug resistance protein-like MFS transporter|uniref:MFS transporter n=2 Tax=Latilactobacillus curvatus TaxID=28038 RepID=A0AAJ5RED6_LATCU|nr:multidrug efflux MFS transporter [Latilactobacillus curvatus]AOO74892.1 multidrug transporter subunit MdtG [Latilactobacillus curvatus]ASN61431.1 MFS transporter [Latilactobacillus curvatus]AWV72332.1 MFS transporter [Latilactobacillus curvatus]AZP96999.1 MFS transporter [Latilactobacillus curvatus]KHO12475.1 major Facilitator Superfamily protein [Latilactobacillus curvatus]